jgi:crotonobetainyl-CoA:carnitine CoA-transferase CaiB-like acyl-CoA transferase
MRPLAGVKVLELAEYAFVPSSCAVLGEWGAEVVKVERTAGDQFRVPVRAVPAGASAYNTSFEQYNRNKRGVALALDDPRGRALLDRLIAWADVFVSSYRPQALRKLRLEPEQLWAVNPRLVYAHGNGQGSRGPESEAGGFDAVSYWARGGIGQRVTPEGVAPVAQPGAFGDAPSGLALAGGICAALLGVQRSGRGVVVEVSLLGNAVWQLGADLSFVAWAGGAPPRDVSRVPNPLIGEYATSDGRRLMFVMLDVERFWEPTCRALGCTDLLGHPDYATLAQKRAAAAPLRARFEAIIAARPLAYWEKELRAHGCIFSKFATFAEVIEDPQVVANGYLFPHPDEPNGLMVAAPVQFDRELPALRRVAPRRAGEHTDEVFAELGISRGELAKLRADGVIA